MVKENHAQCKYINYVYAMKLRVTSQTNVV